MLPPPAGTHLVGTEVHHLTVPARGAPPDAGGRRALTLQLWYPAAAPSAERATYVADPRVLAALVEEGYYDQSREWLSAWGDLPTSSWQGAAPIETEGPLPLVVLSHGLGVLRSGYTTLAEGLASRGFVVVGLSHPYGSISRTPSGEVLSLRQDSAFDDAPETLRAYESAWAADLVFALDWLAGGGSKLLGAEPLETARAAAVGHSLGGAAAFEACRSDERFVACVNMDGLSHGAVREEGVGGPALYLKSSPLYSESDHAARGRTPEEWEEMVRSVRPRLLEPLRAAASRPSYFVEIVGTGHMSFTDAPYLMPETLSRFGGTYLTPERTLEVVLTVLAAFLGEHLVGDSGTPLEDVLGRYREVTWEGFQPGGEPVASRCGDP